MIEDNENMPPVSDVHDFDSLYYKHHKAVYANILKILKDPEKAADVLQEVFMALWVNKQKLVKENVANWLFVVSYNKSVTLLKNQEKHRLTMAGYRLLDNGMQDNQGEKDMERRMAFIQTAIEKLPAQKRKIFKKYRLDGQTLEDIAKEMNLSVNTVKDHLKIAHKLIRLYASKEAIGGSGDILFIIYFTFFIK